MAYSVQQLITGAFYASGVVSREFETVSSAQSADALQWLNDILTEKRVDDGMIPYETTYTFSASIGVEKYYIPDLISIDTIVFYKNQVRFALTYEKRNMYFGSPRVQNINSLPFEWYFERQTGGGNLYLYFNPDQNYPFEIHGAFNLSTVTAFQDLSLNTTVADLGIPTIYSGGYLAPNQLVINTIDLTGTYPNIGSLVNYINSGVISGVSASINVNDFILSSTTIPPTPIYVQSAGWLNGTNSLGNVAAATTGNLTATYSNGTLGVGATLTNAAAMAALVVDGYAVSLNDRILVKNQTNPTQNGSYMVTVVGSGAANWILTRTTNYDQPVQINIGNLFTILNGTVNTGNTYIQTDEVTVIGTSNIEFTLFTGITFSAFSTINNPNYQIFNANGFDEFYITYLRYALADRICSEYNYDTPPNVVRQLGKYESWIAKNSRLMDLRLKKNSSLQDRESYYGWGWANLGSGYLPY